MNDRELAALDTVNGMTNMGGSCSLCYSEYRLRESLRKRGLLKFWKPRSKKWQYCFYDITDNGRKELAS